MADDVPLELCPSLGLFLVPQKKVTVAVFLPTARTVGPSISNWDMMEKLRQGAQPEEFVSLRVEHSSRERINFIGELASLRALRKVVLLLNGKTMRMPGFPEPFKVKASSLDINLPKKKDWEAFYRSKGLANFADGSPGERPDTVRVSRIPVEWFLDKSDVDAGGCPSRALVARAFSQFGALSNVGVHLHKPVVLQLQQTEPGAFSSFGPTPSQPAQLFDAFLQFEDYSGFCSCMLGLKGMHMMRSSGADGGGAGGGVDTKEVACIEIDYDRTGFMTAANTRRREAEEAVVRENRQKERERREEEQRVERERKESEERAERERRHKAKRQRREARQERRLEKKQRDLILQRLKLVNAERHTEAQRLLRVLLSGAAEQVYQEERAEQDTACSMAELRRRVRELERRRRTLEQALSRHEAQDHA